MRALQRLKTCPLVRHRYNRRVSIPTTFTSYSESESLQVFIISEILLDRLQNDFSTVRAVLFDPFCIVLVVCFLLLLQPQRRQRRPMVGHRNCDLRAVWASDLSNGLHRRETLSTSEIRYGHVYEILRYPSLAYRASSQCQRSRRMPR